MPMNETNDLQMVWQARAGEEAAFTALYRRWQGSLYRYSLRLSGSPSIAEDVTQEVFLALMDGCAGFDPALGSFSSYVYGIARNHLLRRMNRERIYIPIEDGTDEEAQGCHPNWSMQRDPLGQLTRQEKIDSLYRAIETLPLHYREIIVLCELQEMSYAEAARVIGCPEGTIRSRLHRARTLLWEKLQEKSTENARAPRVEPVRCSL
jgi:RNA polymerase sigma-70 factor (ECF subfamily)